MKRTIAALGAVTALLSCPRRAAAQHEGFDVPDAGKLSAWDHGAPRTFVAARADVGLLFARPALMLGYGRPHWEWFGVEAYALTTNSFAAAYAGTRASLPFLDFTIGVRDTASYRRSFLRPKAAYTDDDTGHLTGARARYASLDFELSGLLPAPGGYFLWGFASTTLLDAPRDVAVFDESLRVVMRARAAIDFRFGYIAKLGKGGALKLGAMSEVVVIPSRDGPVVRVGPVGALALSDHT